MRSSAVVLLVVALSLGGASSVLAVNWTNADGDNAWDNPNNWDGTWGASGQLDVDMVSPGHAIISDILAAGFEEARRLRVGQNGGTGEIVMTGGTLTLGNQAHTFGFGGTGTLTMSGGTINSVDYLEFGEGRDDGAAPGTGILIMSGGVINVGPEGNNNRGLRIAEQGNNTTGTAEISGTALINASDHVRFGWGGADRHGTLTMTGGEINAGNNFQVGGGMGSTGAFTMSDGIIRTGVQSLRAAPEDPVDGYFDVGNDPATATMTMTGGTIEVDAGMRLGRGGSTFTGTISDGIINIGGNLEIGNGNDTRTIDEVEVVTPSDALLDVLGGTITVGGQVRLGRNQGTGELRVGGGVINVTAGDLMVGSSNPVLDEVTQEVIELQPGTGRLLMTGGIFSVSDANSILVGTEMSTGMLDLYGGTLSAGAMQIGTEGVGGAVDVREGTLVLNGNQLEIVLAYIADGLLTAYGGAPGADWELDYNVRNVGRTTVTAVPEPATLALLGLGALALRRRRRR